jgi:NAD+ kinase
MKYDKVWLVRKLDDPESIRVKAVIDDIMSSADLEDITGQKDKVDDNTLIVSIGGDGTAIEAMKIGAQGNGFVMCFNLGRIGFLADYEPNRVFEYFTNILQGGAIRFEERALLSAVGNQNTTLAVNEIGVSRLYADEMIVYELFIDGAYAGSHRANGVIASTPTGSTAYALSAGGAILHPNVDVIQIVPIAPATMTSRPIIVSAASEIIIKVNVKQLRGKSKQVIVRADGQVTDLSFTEENEDKIAHAVKITGSSNKARIIHPAHWNYFDVLTEKLNWNK